LAFVLLAFVIVFDMGTYSYYRGSVLTPFHGGPVSPTRHHLTLSRAILLPDNNVRLHVYLDAGTPEAPVHVVAADLLNSDEHTLVHWDATELSKLPPSDFANDYPYNRFAPGPFGIRAPMGASATITLEVPTSAAVHDAKYIRPGFLDETWKHP
jgi:thiosulfate dehydrogenase [quinone] large subunit